MFTNFKEEELSYQSLPVNEQGLLRPIEFENLGTRKLALDDNMASFFDFKKYFNDAKNKIHSSTGQRCQYANN